MDADIDELCCLIVKMLVRAEVEKEGLLGNDLVGDDTGNEGDEDEGDKLGAVGRDGARDRDAGGMKPPEDAEVDDDEKEAAVPVRDESEEDHADVEDGNDEDEDDDDDEADDDA
jgi:hypothetical protein